MANKETNSKETIKATPNYEKLYKEERAKVEMLTTKLNEFEKLCKSFSDKANKAQADLQNATLEYTARVDYMLDCVKHAYISIQFAANASQKQGGNI